MSSTQYSRRFTALLIFQQEEEELWKDGNLAKTHTQKKQDINYRIKDVPTSLSKVKLKN